MSDETERFFEDLGQRGYEPLVAKFSGRVRFDLVDGRRTDHWLVAIDKGNLSVSRDGTDADCTIRGDKELFDRLAVGEENAMAAALRGALICTGDIELLLAVQRVFPGPPRVAARSGRS
jgi:predicted lipid carrier protein YhbT